MIATIYPIEGKLDALLKQINELGHGLAVTQVRRSIGGYTLQCQCTEEQADQIEAMSDCDLLGRDRRTNNKEQA